MSNNGNLFNESPEQIRRRVKLFSNYAKKENVEIIKNQYLSHLEYWERVLKKIQH